MKKRGILCFLFCIIMCSSIDVTLKLASLRMNAIQLCFWRFLCGGLSCLPIALRTVNEQRKAKRSSVSPMLFSGLLMVVLSTVLYQVALSVGKASVVSVLYSCSPIFGRNRLMGDAGGKTQVGYGTIVCIIRCRRGSAYSRAGEVEAHFSAVS